MVGRHGALLCFLAIPQACAIKVLGPEAQGDGASKTAEDRFPDIFGDIIDDLGSLGGRRRRTLGNLGPIPHDANVVIFGDSWADGTKDWPAQLALQLGLPSSIWGSRGTTTGALQGQLENATAHGLMARKNDLYIVHSGGNDFQCSGETVYTEICNDEDRFEILSQLIRSFQDICNDEDLFDYFFDQHRRLMLDRLLAFLDTLAQHGAKRIIVSEVPISADMPLLKLVTCQKYYNYSAMPIHIHASTWNSIGRQINKLLSQRVYAFRKKHPGIDIVLYRETIGLEKLGGQTQFFDHTGFHLNAEGSIQVAGWIAAKLTVAKGQWM